MLISVHIPRTAGSSFRAYLRRNPRIRLKEDYSDPILVPGFLRKGFALKGRLEQVYKQGLVEYDCIHGHFLPYKYIGLAGNPHVHFVTWFREPANRLKSHYDQCFQSDKTIDRSPFQNRVARENWSFEAFVSHSRMRNLMSKIFWRFPVEKIDFIGLTEHFMVDSEYLCKKYFDDPYPVTIFGNITKPDQLTMSNDDLELIYKLNERDYELYEKAKLRRKNRVGG